jgi:dihydrofolate reductase
MTKITGMKMKNRKVILYIAASLDGYIAKEDSDISFLSTVESPGEDYGYYDFIRTVDTVVIGRKTYDKVLSFGIPFPHRDKKCYVVSRTLTGKNEDAEFYNGDIPALISELKQKEGGNIFIDGGAEIVFELMKNDLIDRYIISIIPYLLGGGVALFKPGRPEQKLTLKRSISFPSGLVQLWYEKLMG